MSQNVISLLDKLRRPTPAEMARGRRLKTNKQPATGSKRRCRGTTASDPKKVTPRQRVQEFSTEPFSVSNGYLFCKACREQISTKRSIIANHIRSTKHACGKERLASKETRERNIMESLRKYNSITHQRGRLYLKTSKFIALRWFLLFLRLVYL